MTSQVSPGFFFSLGPEDKTLPGGREGQTRHGPIFAFVKTRKTNRATVVLQTHARLWFTSCTVHQTDCRICLAVQNAYGEGSPASKVCTLTVIEPADSNMMSHSDKEDNISASASAVPSCQTYLAHKGPSVPSTPHVLFNAHFRTRIRTKPQAKRVFYGALDDPKKKVKMFAHQARLMRRVQERMLLHDANDEQIDPLLVFWKVGSGKTKGILDALTHCLVKLGRQELSLEQKQHTRRKREAWNGNVFIVVPVTMVGHWLNAVRNTTLALPSPEDPAVAIRFVVLGFDEFASSLGRDGANGISERMLAGSVCVVDESHVLRNITKNMRFSVDALKKSLALFLLSGTPITDGRQAGRLMYMLGVAGYENHLEMEKEYKPPPHRDSEEGKHLFSSLARRVSFYDPGVFRPEWMAENYPSESSESVTVPLSLQQTYMYLKADGKLFLGDYHLADSKRNAYNSVTRSICNGLEGQGTDSPKIKAVCERMKQQRPDAQQVIYSEFVTNGLDLYKVALAREFPEMTVDQIDGRTSDRHERVEAFNSGRTNTMLFSRAGQLGVNFMKTEVMHVTEMPVENSAFLQAKGRAFRFGSHSSMPPDRRNVHIFRYASRFPTRQELCDSHPDGIKGVVRYLTQSYREHVRDRSTADDLSFDILSEFMSLIDDQNVAGGTVEQRIVRDHARRHQATAPWIYFLQCAGVEREMELITDEKERECLKHFFLNGPN